MATAVAYNEWEDPGLAFTEEDLAAHDPQKWATEHVEELLRQVRLVLRHAEIPKIEKADWWRKAADKLIDCVTWLCVAVEVPGIDREEVRVLPDAKSAEGKALTKEALELAPEDWLGQMLNASEADIRHVVTLGRRCAPKWDKRNRSLSNKLAHSLIRERNALVKLETLLTSRTA